MIEFIGIISRSERNAGLDISLPKSRNLRKQRQHELSGNWEKRAKNNHPTVKPLKLMEYLCRLTRTPSGGIVLDPFGGSGTTAVACRNTGRKYIVIEKDPHYCEIARARVKSEGKQVQSKKAKGKRIRDNSCLFVVKENNQCKSC